MLFSPKKLLDRTNCMSQIHIFIAKMTEIHALPVILLPSGIKIIHALHAVANTLQNFNRVFRFFVILIVEIHQLVIFMNPRG
jgi:hypothetical protein